MDNLTHTLTGVMLSRAGLDRVTPRATALLMVAANIPDLDIVSGLAGLDVYLHYHRHWTHAIAAIPVMALLAIALVSAVTRTRLPFLRALVVSSIGVASHALLDWTNHYGIRLLLPFSDAWQALGTTAVIDIWIWTVLLLSLLAPFLSRLVSSEIGAKPSPGRGWAYAALFFLFAYNGVRYSLHASAVAMQESRVYQEQVPRRVAAIPDPANLLVWHGIVETESLYVLHPVNVLLPFNPTGGRIFPKPESSAALETAMRTPTFRNFLEFSSYPLFRVTPADEPERGTRVEAMDLRFGAPPEARFVATAILNERLEVERAWFRF